MQTLLTFITYKGREDTQIAVELECTYPGHPGNTRGNVDNWEPAEGPEFEQGETYVDDDDSPHNGEKVDYEAISQEHWEELHREALEALND